MNNAALSSQMLCRKKPALANSMMPISNTFTTRIIFDFSYLSASWPAVAENRKYGRMNMPGSTVTSKVESREVRLAA